VGQLQYSDEVITFVEGLDDKQLDQTTKPPLDDGTVSV